MQLIDEQSYSKQDFTITPLQVAEYDNCEFTYCNFENTTLKGIVFTECTFANCNFGNANITYTGFKTVTFTSCKLLGLNFSIADPFLFDVKFSGCQMQLVSFYKMKLKNTLFDNCVLQDADFTDADFTGAIFRNCDLNKSVFENTILEKADLSTANNFAIDPERNRIKKAKFSKEGLAGLLYKYNLVIE